MATYRPGRRLRTTSSKRLMVYGMWAAWGAVIAISLRLMHVGTAWVWILILVPPLAQEWLVKARARSYDIEAKHAYAALRESSPAIAEREFAALGKQFRWPRWLSRLSEYNRAQALLRLGRHAEAIELLSRVDARGGVINVDGAIASTLAYAHALLGNVELADEWQAETGRRYARYSSTPPYPFILSETTLALRHGKAREVRNRLENEWTQIEHSLTGERLRPLRVLRAFAIAQSSDPREAGTVAPHLGALQPVRPDEFAYLGAEWPELERFIRMHVAA